MTRLAAAISAPASVFEGLGAAMRRMFDVAPGVNGLEALEREHARIRLTSRHWLVG